MPRLTQGAAEKRQEIIARLRSIAHWAIFQLGGDDNKIGKSHIRQFLFQEGIPLKFLDRWLTPALQMAHEEGRIVKAGAERGRGAGWKLNMEWWDENSD